MTGKLGRDEFVTLYNDLNDWKKAFKEHDVDEGGTMDIHELRRAFKSFGFRLSNRLLVAIGRRYANKAGVIDIQDFMLCSCRLKTIITYYYENINSDRQRLAQTSGVFRVNL
ncbi:calpain small subunit 2-like [Liolophura sinensis]|uniref:calpain small subunit 2-like n=1 Tax=Liolophura sinensis TaxID=3198878 RepID=UPI0031595085